MRKVETKSELKEKVPKELIWTTKNVELEDSQEKKNFIKKMGLPGFHIMKVAEKFKSHRRELVQSTKCVVKWLKRFHRKVNRTLNLT